MNPSLNKNNNDNRYLTNSIKYIQPALQKPKHNNSTGKTNISPKIQNRKLRQKKKTTPTNSYEHQHQKTSSPSNNKYSTNEFQQQKNQLQQTKNQELMMAKHTYDVHSTSEKNSTIINFGTTNVTNHNNKFDKVNEKHNKYRINATKNIQIVENKYRSKIRRRLNKIESRIKQNPKNRNQHTDKRKRTQIQKNRKPPIVQQTRPPTFQKTSKISPKHDPKKAVHT